MQALLNILHEHRVLADPFETTINARFGEGLAEHRANLDLTDLNVHLAEETHAPRAMRGFARGVKVVLQEQPKSKAASWSFNQAAGRIFPIVEISTFSMGVKAASGSSAFTLPLHNDLVFAFVIETDRGLRCLTMAQLESWGVNPDRVRAAARSMLYHRTRDLPWTSRDNAVFTIAKGDGYDAARCMVFEDVFFTNVTPQFRFGIPDPDTLLFVRGDSPAELEALKTAVNQVYSTTAAPLSAGLFAQDGFSLRPADH